MLAIINGAKLQHQKSARLSQEFWVVPKSTVSGEPDWLTQWRVEPEDLREQYNVPEDYDLSNVWVLDGGCPRAVLGKGVKRISFEDTLNNNMEANHGEDSCLSAGASGSTAAVAPASSAASAPAASAASAPRSAATAPANTAAPAPAEVPVTSVPLPSQTSSERLDEALPPPNKKQRVLKMMHSEEHPEDMETTSLEELIVKIKKGSQK